MASIIKSLKRMFIFLWPPIEVWMANRTLKKKIVKQDNMAYQQIFDNFINEINSKSYSSELFSEIEKIEQSEIHRKETLESKSYSLLSALGVTVSLIVLIPTILGNNWGLPKHIAIIAALLFTFAVIHLLVAVYYSTKATSVGPFYMMTTESIENLIKKEPKDALNFIAAEKFTNTKMNQSRLIIKSNCLVGAQALFIRGIIFLGSGALVILIGRILL